jgi:peptidoglycan/xylan/chitin deacetylase (PgdA/CDA1 family)
VRFGRAFGAGIAVAAVLLVACRAPEAAPIRDSPAATSIAPVPDWSGVDRVSLPASAEMAIPALIPPGRAAIRVPILMYHYIRVNPVASDTLGFNLSVTPQNFRDQMDWLTANGYHPVDFNDLRAYFSGKGYLPSRPVVLTFDDGYADLYTDAYPILQAHHFKAVAYLVAGFLGSTHNVSRTQVQEMDAHGIEIAAHTVTHPDLTKLATARMQWEITQSKQDLEQLTGHPILDFCYPAGQFNPNIEQALADAGFSTATTEQVGTLHSMQDRYAWTRVRVSGGENLTAFAGSLGIEEPPLAAGSAAALAITNPLLALQDQTTNLQAPRSLSIDSGS